MSDYEDSFSGNTFSENSHVQDLDLDTSDYVVNSGETDDDFSSATDEVVSQLQPIQLGLVSEVSELDHPVIAETEQQVEEGRQLVTGDDAQVIPLPPAETQQVEEGRQLERGNDEQVIFPSTSAITQVAEATHHQYFNEHYITLRPVGPDGTVRSEFRPGESILYIIRTAAGVLSEVVSDPEPEPENNGDGDDEDDEEDTASGLMWSVVNENNDAVDARRVSPLNASRRNARLQNLFNHIRRRANSNYSDMPSVREVDDSDIPRLSYDDVQNMNFDKSLPDQHQYLGDDLELICNRTVAAVHGNSEVLILPFMPQMANILLIKQSMPMHFSRYRNAAFLRQVLAGDKMFVLLPMNLSARRLLVNYDEAISESYQSRYGDVGVIAEVTMMAEDDIENFKVIAEARERCEVLEIIPGRVSDNEASTSTSYPQSVSSARVKILSNNNLDYNMFKNVDARFSLESGSRSYMKHLCSFTRTPPWLIDCSNVFLIMSQIRNFMSQLFMNESGMARLCDDPSDFSYLVASFLPLSNRVKYKLLTCGCALQRLKLELEFLRCCEFLYCSNSKCAAKLACISEIIVMSNSGALASYVNPGGFVYETLTLNKLCGKVTLTGHPVSVNSWFPGYAWTPASCFQCHSHLGWLFTKTSEDLKPSRFWGISHSALSLNMDIEKKLLNMPLSPL